jgi:hypothetical protein
LLRSVLEAVGDLVAEAFGALFQCDGGPAGEFDAEKRVDEFFEVEDAFAEFDGGVLGAVFLFLRAAGFDVAQVDAADALL